MLGRQYAILEYSHLHRAPVYGTISGEATQGPHRTQMLMDGGLVVWQTIIPNTIMLPLHRSYCILVMAYSEGHTHALGDAEVHTSRLRCYTHATALWLNYVSFRIPLATGPCAHLHRNIEHRSSRLHLKLNLMEGAYNHTPVELGARL